MSKSEISVLKVTRLRGDRPLKAHVDVQIGSWVINDWQMVRSLSLDVLFIALKIHISTVPMEKQGKQTGEHMSKSEISILKVTRLRGDRPLKAFVDVQIGSWVVNDWRIIHRPGKAIEVNYPSVSYRDSQGTIRYRSLLSIPMELRYRYVGTTQIPSHVTDQVDD